MIKGVFLGTGSIPTKERSCQGVLIEFSHTSVLVDCGEGIQYQLLKLVKDLSRINAIFITHEHIDHVYGVGGALTLLLNKYPEKTITVYGPKKAIQIVKAIVDLFMLKNRNYIEYVEIDDGQIIKRDSYICSVIKTYHTESSVGYCFHFENRKIVLLGDVGLPDIRAKEKIVGSISEADFAVIDGVHITSVQAAELAREAKIKSLYLMPILLDKSEEEVFNEVAYIFTNTYIPKDLELFSVE